jgi:dTDP-4-dehydrorhamnose reductase
MKVLVIGANGQLGTDVVQAFVDNGDDVCAASHADIEISEVDSVRQKLFGVNPELIVNTAAMHNVDSCEREPDRAYAINALGPRNLAIVAGQTGSVLMHVSTDYVFDGCKGLPYHELDLPRPLNVYGNTKLAGEYYIRTGVEKHFVLRTSALYGKAPCRGKGGRNFVELMLKLAGEGREIRVVDEEVVSPTPTDELARQIVGLSRSKSYGLYHATAEGSCSWFEFARTIFAVSNVRADLRIASPGEFPAKVARPQCSVLQNRALTQEGLNVFGAWQAGLLRYLREKSVHG